MPIKVTSFNHTGQVVPNLGEALRVFRAVFGLEPTKLEELPGLAKIALLTLDDGAMIEVIEILPSDEGQHLAASLPAYHFCLEVDNVDAALSTLAAEGVELLDQQGRPGVAGPRIGFLAPAATCGMLIELVQKKV